MSGTSTTIYRLYALALALVLLGVVAIAAPAAHASCSGVTPVSNETQLNAAIVAYNATTTTPCVFTIQLTADINLTASTTSILNSTANVSLVIKGAGFTVNGQNISGVRPFELASSNNRPVTFNQITITGGYVPGQPGGGIASQGGALIVTNSTITGNRADTGGGISICSLLGCGLTLQNSTISGNRADSSFGGGILTSGPATIDSSTIVDNQACSACGGALGVTSGNATVTNSILANSTEPGGGASVPDCRTLSATVTDGGYNLVETPGSTCSFTATSSITSQDPVLGTLASNGGPTQTHALLTGSPAIDAGSTTLTTDQRGVPRPQGTADDIGAYESAPAGIDFGDAPASYGNPGHFFILANGGFPNLSLGIDTAPDAETAMQPTVDADGDDTTGTDDENGVTLTTRFGTVAAQVTVLDLATPANPGILCGWVDGANGGALNGAFEAGEGQCLTVATDTACGTGFPQVCNLSFNVSALAAPSMTYARFRVSTDALTTASGGAGIASDGEVEDYRIDIEGQDAGDAPTGGTLVGGVARDYNEPVHVLSANLFLGAAAPPDADFVSRASVGADGDDTTGTDDEDGVELTLGAGFTAVVTVTNNTGQLAFLRGWIDGFNDLNGAFGLNESKTTAVPASGNNSACQEINAGPYRFRCTLSWPPGNLTALKPGDVTYARFRVASTDPQSAVEGDGEIEDYRIVVPAVEDRGDAPAGYGEAIHTISRTLYLGSAVDAEPANQPSADALGDDNDVTGTPPGNEGGDDEDGVTFSTPAGGGANVIANVTVTNNTGGAVTLCGWLDADTNNVFDPGEQRCAPPPWPLEPAPLPCRNGWSAARPRNPTTPVSECAAQPRNATSRPAGPVPVTARSRTTGSPTTPRSPRWVVLTSNPRALTACFRRWRGRTATRRRCWRCWRLGTRSWPSAWRAPTPKPSRRRCATTSTPTATARWPWCAGTPCKNTARSASSPSAPRATAGPASTAACCPA